MAAARLRKALAECHRLSLRSEPPEPAASSGSPCTQPNQIASWAEHLPPKLTSERVSSLVETFKSNYPGELLDADTTPSIRLLSLVLELSRAVKAQGKASVHGDIGLHGFIAPACEVCVSSHRGILSLMMRPQAEWKGQGDDAQGNAQHTRDWSSDPSYSRSLHSAGQSHGRNLRTLLQLGDSACVLLRLGGLWPGLRGLAVRLPFIAFPAGVNAEGVMVFVNACGTRGGATEGQIIEVHPPAAVPRVQKRVRCKAQVREPPLA